MEIPRFVVDVLGVAMVAEHCTIATQGLQNKVGEAGRRVLVMIW